MKDVEATLDGVAIIGMAGRFPGAADLRTFWSNLLAGRESITRFDPEEAEDAFPLSVRALPNYVPARGMLPDVEMFDAEFFGVLARDAELMDPQHRIFLECAWEALEDAGYDPAACAGAIGVFAGASMNTYLLRNVIADRAAREEFTSTYQVGSYGMLLGALSDVLATRVSYKFGLRGPSMTLQTACSTSLVAVAQACQSLLTYQSDMALAGGVSVTFPQRRGYLFQEGGMVAPDGHCRAFDARSGGTVFSSGAGVVLLKRLSDAVSDGDGVYAVIRGFAVNNDGNAKAGFTAPSVEGQAEVIAAAHAMAGIAADSIGYVECHGTGTPLGDPIEVAGLSKAFGPVSDEKRCALGTVKTNIGHLDIAAGVAGLIKTALALRHGELPPTLHFERPNPAIAFAGTPFFVNDRRSAWPQRSGPRRAGVSAFGVGGTNAHTVLEEAPPSAHAPASAACQLIILSARSEAALREARARLATHLRDTPAADLGDVAWTLQAGRRAFAHRWAAACASTAEAVTRLEDAQLGAAVAPEQAPPAVFMFPGQGSQFPAMGRGLYERYPVFRATMERCAALLRPALDADLCDLLYGRQSRALIATSLVQPALFAVEYSLAQLWLDWGVKPTAAIGHSVGEFVAACLAGVMSLEDALALVALRGKLLGALPGGAMLAVRLPERELLAKLPPSVDLAAVNGPSLCVVAGPEAAVAAVELRLSAEGVIARRLQTSHAFHSAMMDPALPALAEHVGRIRLRAPQLPYVSGVTGRWITADEATSAEYWARHCRAPVRFADGLASLAEEMAPVLLEVGPGRALAGMAQQGAGRKLTVVSALPEPAQGTDGTGDLLAAAGRLWTAGVQPNWRNIHGEERRRRVSLPTYPFQRRRYWVDAPAAEAAAPAGTACAPAGSPAGGAAPVSPALPAPAATAGSGADASLLEAIRRLLEGLSGEELADADPQTTFLELGFDSLLLGQFVQRLHAQFGVTIGFRSLLSELPSMRALAAHLARILPPEPLLLAPATEPALAGPAATEPTPSASTVAPAEAGGVVERVMREQMRTMQELFARQMAVLAGAAAPQPAKSATALVADQPARLQVYAGGPRRAADGEMTPAQRAGIEALVARYAARTAGSKRRAQAARPTLADPRAAAGFRSEWKEIIYPLVCARAKGSRIWDVDGNEYVDLVNGYGQTAFGHSPDFVLEAITAQLDRGFPIGPQAELAGEVSQLFCAMTGNERMTFCNTGSEAVMAAMRVARTVTGRRRIVMFAGDYHGQFDEVLAKGARSGVSPAVPAVPGVPAESVGNMVVLPYGHADSLAWIRDNAGELAAVLVEPVQSRAPQLRPRDFVQGLREITAAAGTALVFDEVVTGFRVHPGGMQAVWGVRADLATYGKVVGGGMPVGILAGTARFMDALDGGSWCYGDESAPEVPPTFFAGTFVRHPLTLAACRAVLRHMEADGPRLLDAAAARTQTLAARLNEDLARHELASCVNAFSSWAYLNVTGESPFAGLLWHHLRDRGIHVQDGFPCFLTTAHTDADIERIAAAFGESLDEMAQAGLVGPRQPAGRVEPQTPAEAPLTGPQMEVLLASQLGDEASCAFNESVSLELAGPLDRPALLRSLQEVVARHDALRTRLDIPGKRMLIEARVTLEVPEVDGTVEPDVLERVIAAEAELPFDLARGPLLRARLVRLGPAHHVLVLTAHHIVCDGWSTNVIFDELGTLYASSGQGELPPALSFAEHARALSPSRPETKQYWASQFEDFCPPLELPGDRKRPAVKSYRGATYRTSLAAPLAAALRRAGAQHGCTLFMTMLAGFQILLGRLCGQSDLAVGIPTAGQADVAGGALVGHCVNFLPLRARWQSETTVADFLAAVRTRVLEANEHKDTTLGDLVRMLAIPREPGRVPLVEAQFNLERLPAGLAFPSLRATLDPNPKRFVNFDLFLNAIESPGGIRIDVDFNTDLFDPATIARWMEAYAVLLAAISVQAAGTVARLPIVPEADRATLAAGNATARDFRTDVTADSLVAAQAARTPDRDAVRCGGAALTYRELDEYANRLARCLQERVGGRARIAVLLGRSLELPAVLLGVMRAGLTYVPLDPAHPAGRLKGIIDHSRAALVITAGGTVADFGVPTLDLHDDAATIAGTSPRAPERAGSLGAAYVIYTSGSTGAPKGVEVGHGSLVNLLLSTAERPGLGEGERLLAVTTPAFDIAALELFLPLIAGGEVVLATADQVVDPVALLQALRQPGIDVVQATPSLWRLLLEAGFQSRPGLRMLSGGETLHRDLADRLLAGGGELWNMYGPTETTIWSATSRIEADGTPITIGVPIANTQFHILDANDQPVPVGVVGELNITGSGLALGYVDQPELTAAAFRTVELAGQPVLAYRTGDLARWTASGAISLLGRRDTQVKLRGFRIELGEVEAVVLRSPAVATCAATIQTEPDGSSQLVCHYVLNPGETLRVRDLRQAVAAVVPEYMVPSQWIRLHSMPLNTSGKIDRKALPGRSGEASPPAGPIAPRTPVEMKLAGIWAEVLNREMVGVSDNLFALGADSLHLFQIAARMSAAGIPLSARHLLRNPTVEELALACEGEAAQAPALEPPSLASFRRQRGHATHNRGAAA